VNDEWHDKQVRDQQRSEAARTAAEDCWRMIQHLRAVGFSEEFAGKLLLAAVRTGRMI